MQNANNMKLTDNERAAINKMNGEKCIDLLHECAERLGLVPVKEYSKITGMEPRTVYDHIQKGKIKTVEFCGSILIPINK